MVRCLKLKMELNMMSHECFQNGLKENYFEKGPTRNARRKCLEFSFLNMLITQKAFRKSLE